MTRVLITGFEPFKDAPTNPSWDAVEILERTWDGPADLIARRLPVVFGEAPTRLMASVGKHLPDVVIAVGVAEGTTGITLERVAVNMDVATIPDNAGNSPVDTPIVEDAPLALPTTLPVRDIEGSLKSAGIPVRLSMSAGTYVCNHTFYMLQRELGSFGVPSGFIHVPATDAMGLGEDVPTMPVEQIAEGLRLAIEATLATLPGAVHRRSTAAVPFVAPISISARREMDDAEATQAFIPAFADDEPEEEATQAYLPPFVEEAAPAGEVPEGDVPALAPVEPETTYADDPAAARTFTPPTPAPVEVPEDVPTLEPLKPRSVADIPQRAPQNHRLSWDEIISGPGES